MKYEFHVGDYIECHNGNIGYLTDGKTWYSGKIGQDVICLQGNITVGVSCGFTPFTMSIPFSDVSKYFNRIGQYDFTKPKPPKEIERLNNCNWNSTTAKINELVDAVNELRKANSNAE